MIDTLIKRNKIYLTEYNNRDFVIALPESTDSMHQHVVGLI